MELQAEGVAFSLMFCPPDNEGWMWCNAIVNAPGFRGDLDFQMLRDDLEAFRSELAAAIDSSNWPCGIGLASAEPGISVSFRVERGGNVAGEFRFVGREPYRPVLSGPFEMDQTYLPPLLAQVDKVLADLP